MQKSANLASNSIGREGIIGKDEAKFFFSIKDIMLDGEIVAFAELDDTTAITNLSQLNSFLKSEPFYLSNNSDFSFSASYNCGDSTKVYKAISYNSSVIIAVELIEEGTGNLLGSYLEKEITKQTLINFSEAAYKINTDGIGSKKVRLQLRIEENVGAEYALADISKSELELPKQGFVQSSYEGSLEVKDYHLSQNYPNPRLRYS
ncbi:MAG: hypothetical protein KJ799_11495 [Bacteroidetes bacterium]|nr:hypothetical protein [Bacteroidota bacterium]MBU1677904.1 hypothetical protein [Bacteroidota bacterium]MBU2507329.1 hypothetical protein [Bacteroidota bacterium]